MLLMFKTAPNESFTYPKVSGECKTIYENTTEAIKIRNISLAELVDVRTKLLIPEGWPGIKFTLNATYVNDQDGFYCLEKNGKMIGSISVVCYPKISLGYVGLYVLDRSFRGKGYGDLLLQKALEHTTANRNISSFGLNCAESLCSMYKKHGFKISTTDNFWKYTGPNEMPKSANRSTNYSGLNDFLFQDIVRFDESILGSNRLDFLRAFLFKPITSTGVWQEDGKILGFGAMSGREPAVNEAHKSYKIGPVYANSDSIAKALLESLIKQIEPNESVYLETPGDNPKAALVMSGLDFAKIGIQAKMFKGEVPNFDTKRIFGYSSIAVGG